MHVTDRFGKILEVRARVFVVSLPFSFKNVHKSDPFIYFSFSLKQLESSNHLIDLLLFNWRWHYNWKVRCAIIQFIIYLITYIN